MLTLSEPQAESVSSQRTAATIAKKTPVNFCFTSFLPCALLNSTNPRYINLAPKSKGNFIRVDFINFFNLNLME